MVHHPINEGDHVTVEYMAALEPKTIKAVMMRRFGGVRLFQEVSSGKVIKILEAQIIRIEKAC